MKSQNNYENIDALGTAKFFAQAEKFKEAKIALDLVKPYCFNVAQIDAIGKLYSDIREFNDCLELALKLQSMVIDPEDVYNVTSNIIRAYLNLNNPIESLKYIEINERRKPDDHPNLMDKAMAYFLLNRKEEGEKILRQILINPQSQDVENRVKFNLGTYDLAKGNFHEGLKGFLIEGRKLDIWKSFSLPKEKEWKGNICIGKTVLLVAEGGIGDEIINIRFLEHFKKLNMNAVWYTTRKDLAEIFIRNGFSVITNLQDSQRDWLWCYSMTVPYYLNLTEKDLWKKAYLSPQRKKEKLSGRLKIGFKYMGNSKYDQDLHRTIPYKKVLDVLPKDATIYSFHVDEDIEDDRIIPLKDKIKTWDDTLDYLDQMDIIVSSCTGLVHAASAMGNKTIVMVPILNYYVWAYPSRHSSWYSNNTIILRQTEYDNWNAPIEELKDYMNENFSQG